MDSAHGTKTVRLQRKKSGLGFSVKGGQEHGVPIVVSWITPNSAAAKQLRLGDVILAVNGRSLQGARHTEAVQRLKQAGPAVLLRVRPDQVLADVFSVIETEPSSEGEGKREDSSDTLARDHTHLGPLPAGWERKIDVRTGRPYFENHWTESTSWTDPRSLQPIPLAEFDWKTLPPSWERQLNDNGDVYYVCHDTQTTHWDSPRGRRQLKQLKELNVFIQHQKQLLKTKELELRGKREKLLEKNITLASLPNQTTTDTVQLEPTTIPEDKEEEAEHLSSVAGESPDDVIDDIMSLNEEVEVLDEEIALARNQLRRVSEVVTHAQYEDIGEEDEYEAAASLSHTLSSNYDHFKSVEAKLRGVIQSLEGLRRERGFSDTPLQYMIQLPPLREQDEGAGQWVWLHTLPDKLTGKTNCEMRLEICLLQEMTKYGKHLQQRLARLHSCAVKCDKSQWNEALRELAGLDFTPFQDQWLQAGCTLQEKIDKLFARA